MRRSVGLKVITLILVTAAAGVHIVEMDSKNSSTAVSEAGKEASESSVLKEISEQIPEEPSIVEDGVLGESFEPEETISENTVSDDTVEIVMVGDVLMHDKVIASGLQEDGSYNYDALFAHVKDKTEGADLALVDQETILGGTELGVSGYPVFNAPQEVGTAEAEAGFDVILHANNHALDKGAEGIANTINFWEENYPWIGYVGINKGVEHQNSILYIERNGIKIAVLNYTYGTNRNEDMEGSHIILNFMDEGLVARQLDEAEHNADFTIVCPHWGNEYSLTRDSYQEKWTEIFFEHGADLVIGAHPHVIEPVEMISKDGKNMLVYYSLGNFVSATSESGDTITNRMVGGMADVVIGRDENDKVVIQSYDAIPLVCHLGEKEVTAYFLSDYTEELAASNKIVSQDPGFSLEKCRNLVKKIWEK